MADIPTLQEYASSLNLSEGTAKAMYDAKLKKVLEGHPPEQVFSTFFETETNRKFNTETK